LGDVSSVIEKIAECICTVLAKKHRARATWAGFNALERTTASIEIMVCQLLASLVKKICECSINGNRPLVNSTHLLDSLTQWNRRGCEDD
jgi:hypothetical protein